LCFFVLKDYYIWILNQNTFLGIHANSVGIEFREDEDIEAEFESEIRQMSRMSDEEFKQKVNDHLVGTREGRSKRFFEFLIIFNFENFRQTSKTRLDWPGSSNDFTETDRWLARPESFCICAACTKCEHHGTLYFESICVFRSVSWVYWIEKKLKMFFGDKFIQWVGFWDWKWIFWR
jgi:hypothetical protein